MTYLKYLSCLSTLVLTLSVELMSFSLAAPPPRAQSTRVNVRFPPTTSVGAPARTAGGGRRSVVSCVTGKTPLTALAPTNNVGTTVSANPTLFLFVPETIAESAEFILVDEQGNDIYETSVAIDGTPGVVKLNLPATVSLEAGKQYLWQFALICDPEFRLPDEAVQGLLERTELSPQQQRQVAQFAEPLKQAEAYAQARIWQETIAILAKLHQARPNDPVVTEAWKELLNSVQLEEAIVTAPLVDCCTAEN